MNAEVHLNRAKVMAIPEESIVKWEGKNYVFTEQSASHYKMVPIETGIAENGFVELKTDLKGASVVTKNAYTILMKMKNTE